VPVHSDVKTRDLELQMIDAVGHYSRLYLLSLKVNPERSMFTSPRNEDGWAGRLSNCQKRQSRLEFIRTAN